MRRGLSASVVPAGRRVQTAEGRHQDLYHHTHGRSRSQDHPSLQPLDLVLYGKFRFLEMTQLKYASQK